MGFEPTTFCMASLATEAVPNGTQPRRRAGLRPIGRAVASALDTLRFTRISGDLGTATRAVPNRQARDGSAARLETERDLERAGDQR
ncbi:MAG TPA: hypothetical protein VK506_04990 [Conexibacter sp.]|nr:hypothetical protein [Conexibacter sp.]